MCHLSIQGFILTVHLTPVKAGVEYKVQCCQRPGYDCVPHHMCSIHCPDTGAGMTGAQFWGPEDDVPDLVSDDSEEEEAAVNRQPRPPRPDAEALLTLGVRSRPPLSHQSL